MKSAFWVTWLFACAVSGIAQQAPDRKEPSFYQQGRVIQITHLKLDLNVQSPHGLTAKSFSIATNALIVDEAHPGDLVNVSYVKRRSQLIVVCLQRDLDLDFDDGQEKSGHLGVAELTIPDSESSRILSRVGPIEARTETSSGGGGGGTASVGFRGAIGTVVRIRSLDQFRSELTIQPEHREKPRTFIIDLLTVVVGQLRKGSQVTVESEDEKGEEYATNIFVEPDR